jgi:hypothetical protein
MFAEPKIVIARVNGEAVYALGKASGRSDMVEISQSA